MKSLQLPVTNAKGLRASDELLDAPIELLMSALPCSQGAENSKASARGRVSSTNPRGGCGRPWSLWCCRAHRFPETAVAALAQPLLLALRAPTQHPAHWPKRQSAGRATPIAVSCLNLSIFSSYARLRESHHAPAGIIFKISLIFSCI